MIKVPKHFDFLRPVASNLQRIGANHDGGYVVDPETITTSTSLLSLGIASEWSFDKHFLRIVPNSRYVAVDRSSGFLVNLHSAITKSLVRGEWAATLGSLRTAIRFLALVPPWPIRTKRRFIRKWMKAVVSDSQREIALEDPRISGLLTRCFLKMDVEGDEYLVLPGILDFERKHPGSLSGMCIEFHDVNRRYSEFHSIVTSTRELFDIVHIHCNNATPLEPGDSFASTIELSFAPKRANRTFSQQCYPLRGIDYPNDPSSEDIEFMFCD